MVFSKIKFAVLQIKVLATLCKSLILKFPATNKKSFSRQIQEKYTQIFLFQIFRIFHWKNDFWIMQVFSIDIRLLN